MIDSFFDFLQSHSLKNVKLYPDGLMRNKKIQKGDLSLLSQRPVLEGDDNLVGFLVPGYIVVYRVSLDNL